MSAPLPMSVKLDDLPDALKGNHLLAVKAWMRKEMPTQNDKIIIPRLFVAGKEL